MAVLVEFYGIPRARSGTDSTTAEGETLGQVIESLRNRFPEFARACVEGNRLRRGYVANIDGNRFVSDPNTPLRAGETMLILSADAGG